MLLYASVYTITLVSKYTCTYTHHPLIIHPFIVCYSRLQLCIFLLMECVSLQMSVYRFYLNGVVILAVRIFDGVVISEKYLLYFNCFFCHQCDMLF